MTHFEVFRDAAQGYRFRLRANNGEIVAVSESYQELESCLDTITIIKSQTADAAIQLVL